MVDQIIDDDSDTQASESFVEKVIPLGVTDAMIAMNRARHDDQSSHIENRNQLMRIIKALGGNLNPDQIYKDAFERGLKKRLDKALAAKDDDKIQQLLEMLYSYTSK